MPPQKNSGNKGFMKQSSASKKSNGTVDSFIFDLKSKDIPQDVYIARVIKKFGNGRVQVVYSISKDTENSVIQITQAVIRGSFRGKSKRSVWIDDGTIVLIANTGVSGSSEFEIIAIVENDHIREIRKCIQVDERIFAKEITDPEILMARKFTESQLGGFVFESIPEEKELDESDIDAI